MVKSSKQWLRRHVTDGYVRQARAQGYRSRAAFKLLEIDAREKLLRPGAHGILMHTMYYAAEVRQPAEYGQTDSVELKAQEIKLAQQLIGSLAGKFSPKKYVDEYQQRVAQLLEAKRKGHAVAEAPAPQLAPVIDLMEALKKSLAERQAAPAQKKPPARAVAAAAGTRRKKSAT